MITYLKELYTFSADKVLEIIQVSIKSSQIDVDKTLFRNDLTESTCMLVLDGLDYTFSHRSFQEYFAAYFMSRIKVDEFQRAIPKLVQRSAFDNVLKMLAEMNKEKFEEAWALPTLRFLCDRVKGIDAKKNCLKFAAQLLGGSPRLYLGEIALGSPQRKFRVHFGSGEAEKTLGEANRNPSQMRVAIYNVYGMFNRIWATLKDVDEKENITWQKIRRGEILKDDPRFEIVRNWAQQSQKEPQTIRLNERDSEWLCDTHFGMFMAAESELLPKLRDEVAHRVAERKRGLSEIFPT
jgi:hypothetical protein